MKAHEATKLVEYRTSELGAKDMVMYNTITEKIKSDILSSNKAIYSTVIYEHPTDFVVNKLREDGFICRIVQTGYNESGLEVSWPNPSLDEVL